MQRIDITGLKVKTINSISTSELLSTDDEIYLEVDLKGVELERLFDELIGNFGFDELIRHLEKTYNQRVV